MTHVHRLRPLWLLLCSPAWATGFHQVVAHARCLDCGYETYVAAWQSPTAVQGRLGEEGEADG